jgi:hypothetical protein
MNRDCVMKLNPSTPFISEGTVTVAGTVTEALLFCGDRRDRGMSFVESSLNTLLPSGDSR